MGPSSTRHQLVDRHPGRRQSERNRALPGRRPVGRGARALAAVVAVGPGPVHGDLRDRRGDQLLADDHRDQHGQRRIDRVDNRQAPRQRSARCHRGARRSSVVRAAVVPARDQLAARLPRPVGRRAGLWTVAGIGILAWSTSRALGRWAAALTACALLCAGTAGRFMFFSFDWHGPTALHVVLLGAIDGVAGRASRAAAPGPDGRGRRR